MNKITTFLSLAALVGSGVSLVGQSITVSVNTDSSGRIMSSNGPAHLGGGNISGVIGVDNAGDTLVGDNAGDSFNFSLILGFDTTAAFRTAVAGGAPVILTGRTLYGVDDGFGGIDVKSTGNVNWAPISASVNAVGSTVDAPYGDNNQWRRHAAFNLGDGPDAAANYQVAGPLNFAENPYAQDTTFSVDMTSVFAGLPLDADTSRIMIGISAWAPDLSALFSGDGTANRVAFYGDSFELTAIPEPSTYAAIFGLLALGLIAWRRRSRN